MSSTNSCGSSSAAQCPTLDSRDHLRPALPGLRPAAAAERPIAVDLKRRADRLLLGVLALGATGGTALQLTAGGPDAAVALDALGECVAAFG